MRGQQTQATLCGRSLCVSGELRLVFSPLLCSLLRHLSNYRSSPLYVASSSKGSHMTGLSSSFAFFDVQRRRVGSVGGGAGVEVGGGVGVGGVAAGETKPDTGYLEAEMGGACMPNGDTDQRLISLGAHFNLATQNTHTHFPACTHTHTHTHSKPKTSYNGSHVDISSRVVRRKRRDTHTHTHTRSLAP